MALSLHTRHVSSLNITNTQIDFLTFLTRGNSQIFFTHFYTRNPAMHGVIFLITKFKNHCQHGHNPITIQSPKYLPSTNTLEWHLCDTILDTASPPLFLDKMPVAGGWCVWGRQCCIWQLAEQCPVCRPASTPRPSRQWDVTRSGGGRVVPPSCAESYSARFSLLKAPTSTDEKLGCLSAKNIT